MVNYDLGVFGVDGSSEVPTYLVQLLRHESIRDLSHITKYLSQVYGRASRGAKHLRVSLLIFASALHFVAFENWHQDKLVYQCRYMQSCTMYLHRAFTKNRTFTPEGIN